MNAESSAINCFDNLKFVTLHSLSEIQLKIEIASTSYRIPQLFLIFVENETRTLIDFVI